MRFRGIALAALFALLISALTYLQNTCPYPLFDKLDLFSKFSPILGENDPFPEDVMLVSTSHDKMLVDTDSGRESVSDRQKLTKFLNILDSVGTYRYIFYDLLLEKEFRSEYDSSLVEVLAGMPRLVMAKSASVGGLQSSLQDSVRLHEKSAYNDYGYTATQTSFTRYQFIQNGEASVALKMYRALGSPDDTIRKFGPLYVSHSRLCSGSPLIVISRNMCSFDAAGNALITRCNLGKDYLDMPLEDLLSEVDGKIIIIGDFDGDVHGTYIGKVSGPLLAYSVYDFLSDKKHIVSFMTMICFFLLYFLLSLSIIFSLGPRLVNRFVRGRIGAFVSSFLSYTVILSIVSLLEFRIHGIIVSTFLPSMLLSLLSVYYSKGVMNNQDA